jgi:hypothetical protein
MDYADNLRGKKFDWDEIPAMSAQDYLTAYEDEKDKQQRNLVGRKTTGSLAKDKR